MMLIEGEHFNTGSNLFDHIKIPGDTPSGSFIWIIRRE